MHIYIYIIIIIIIIISFSLHGKLCRMVTCKWSKSLRSPRAITFTVCHVQPVK